MSNNGQVGEKPAPVMRRGCILGFILFSVMVSGLGYMFISTLSDVMPPEELQPYTSLEETLKLVHSSTAAPGPGKRLTQENVEFFINGLDSVNASWEQLEPALAAQVEKSNEKIDIIRSYEEFKEMIHLPFYTRQGLVNYLNLEGKSWDEYLWAKARIVAASGITQEEAHTVLRSLYSTYFILEDQQNVLETIRDGSDSFYTRVDSLRENGVDSTEIALVAPYRDVLLSKGLHSLMGVETMFPE